MRCCLVSVLKNVFSSHFSHPYLCNINRNDMDISNLTSLINALRAETQEDSITPESLGALLQRIVDVLGDAASDFTMQQFVCLFLIEFSKIASQSQPFLITLRCP